MNYCFAMFIALCTQLLLLSPQAYANPLTAAANNTAHSTPKGFKVNVSPAEEREIVQRLSRGLCNMITSMTYTKTETRVIFDRAMLEAMEQLNGKTYNYCRESNIKRCPSTDTRTPRMISEMSAFWNTYEDQFICHTTGAIVGGIHFYALMTKKALEKKILVNYLMGGGKKPNTLNIDIHKKMPKMCFQANLVESNTCIYKSLRSLSYKISGNCYCVGDYEGQLSVLELLNIAKEYEAAVIKETNDPSHDRARLAMERKDDLSKAIKNITTVKVKRKTKRSELLFK